MFWHFIAKLAGAIAWRLGVKQHLGRDLIRKLREMCPFKHETTGEAEFVRKVMKKETNGEITNCQTDSACLLMSISVSRERKKQKEETLTAINWLGAAQEAG